MERTLPGGDVERCAPVQGDMIWRGVAIPPGTIAWAEHHRVWVAYASKYGSGQSAERIAERGGFGYLEIVALAGRRPSTWRPR